MKRTMMLSLMAALTFSACSGKQEKEKPLSQSNFDLSVAPGVDFISMLVVVGLPIIR